MPFAGIAISFILASCGWEPSEDKQLIGSIAFCAPLGATQWPKQPDLNSHRIQQVMRCTRLNSQAREVRAHADGVLLGGPHAICKGWRFRPWRCVSKRLDSTTTSSSCRANMKHRCRRMNAAVLPNSASVFLRPCCTQSTQHTALASCPF
jgi:hypothetical protein